MNRLALLTPEQSRAYWKRAMADVNRDELRRTTRLQDSEAIGSYLATLNDVRATRRERLRRWLRRMTFGRF